MLSILLLYHWARPTGNPPNAVAVAPTFLHVGICQSSSTFSNIFSHSLNIVSSILCLSFSPGLAHMLHLRSHLLFNHWKRHLIIFSLHCGLMSRSPFSFAVFNLLQPFIIIPQMKFSHPTRSCMLYKYFACQGIISRCTPCPIMSLAIAFIM